MQIAGIQARLFKRTGAYNCRKGPNMDPGPNIGTLLGAVQMLSSVTLNCQVTIIVMI